MKTIRWGIIGAGRISSTFATALNALGNVKLTAVAARDLDRAKEFAERFHFEKAYGSYEEIVKDPEVDVIYIGTPHTEHRANAALCITNKKSVLCEKPFTINAKDTQYLIDLAKEHKVFLMEAMWTKFLPVNHIVKQWIKEKRIGEIKHMKVSFGFYSEFDINSRLFNPDVAGGALLDAGVYPVTYAIYMMDRLPDQILSSAEIGRSNVDEQNIIIFKFGNGILADLSSSVSVNTGKEAVIIGDKGKIIVPKFWQAKQAQMYDLNDNLIDTIAIPHEINGYEYEIREVNQCLSEERTESLVVPLQDTLSIMKVLDTIRNQWGLVYPGEV